VCGDGVAIPKSVNPDDYVNCPRCGKITYYAPVKWSHIPQSTKPSEEESKMVDKWVDRDKADDKFKYWRELVAMKDQKIKLLEKELSQSTEPPKKYPSVAEAAKKMYEQTTKDIVDCWEGRKDEKP
jgi:hypothetical protein